jgi:hypothetical protein
MISNLKEALPHCNSKSWREYLSYFICKAKALTKADYCRGSLWVTVTEIARFKNVPEQLLYLE